MANWCGSQLADVLQHNLFPLLWKTSSIDDGGKPVALNARATCRRWRYLISVPNATFHVPKHNSHFFAKFCPLIPLSNSISAIYVSALCIESLGERLHLASRLTSLTVSRPSSTTIPSTRLLVKNAVELCPRLAVLHLRLFGLGNETGCILAEALQRSNSNSITKLLLRSCSLHAEAIEALSEVLKTNTTLRHLDLQGNILADRGCIALGQLIKSNNTLRCLRLSAAFVRQPGAIALAEALAENRSLIDLSFKRNNFVGTNGLLARAVAIHPSLTQLDLGGCNVDQDIMEIGEALRLNCPLKVLKLRSNLMTGKTLISIGEALAVNTNLEALNISLSAPSREGLSALSNSLRTNTTLRTLDVTGVRPNPFPAALFLSGMRENKGLRNLFLCAVDFPESAWRLLQDMLLENRVLQSLYLDYISGFGYFELRQLCVGLRAHPSLTTISMQSNGISDEGAAEIAQVLLANKVLTHVDLKGNVICDDGAKSLAQVLTDDRNTTLRRLSLEENRVGVAGRALLTDNVRSTLQVFFS